MNKDFAIVKISGRQYKVSKGDKIDSEKLHGKVGEKITFKDVFLTYKKGKVSIGTPIISGLVRENPAFVLEGALSAAFLACCNSCSVRF